VFKQKSLMVNRFNGSSLWEAKKAIIRNIDVTAQSEASFDEACRTVVAEAAKTLRGIMLFRISEAECVVEHDRVIAYRVTGKVVFQVER
jgi:flavin-binding protein dodecin